MSRQLERLPTEARCLLAESADLYWPKEIQNQLSHIVGDNSLENFYRGAAPDKMFRHLIWEGEEARVVYKSFVAMVECEDVPSFEVEILYDTDALGAKIWLPLETYKLGLSNRVTDELQKKVEDHPQASMRRVYDYDPPRSGGLVGLLGFAQALAQELGMAITGLRNPPFRAALPPASLEDA